MQKGDAKTAAPQRQVAMTSRKGRIGLGTTDGSRRRGTPEWREMRKRGGSFGVTKLKNMRACICICMVGDVAMRTESSGWSVA
ncbi:hypothetical protein E2562_006765 [Oryza meyeriana var. granulata]|uniref:Uncharacterized protein n=1 Tax=Oryza meyeriana var. granulata TaxID=110450 RepID=A0A6G1C4Z6_9ORYZ|nr:hypothetical protein E2562_006765 [Oryza meyeriana var. granulata]